MRGHIIAFETINKKNSNSRLLIIENSLSILEKTYRNSGLQQDYNKILDLKFEYNSILGKWIENLLLKRQSRGLWLSRYVTAEQTDEWGLTREPNHV